MSNNYVVLHSLKCCLLSPTPPSVSQFRQWQATHHFDWRLQSFCSVCSASSKMWLTPSSLDKGCVGGSQERREWGEKLNRKQNPLCMTAPPPSDIFNPSHPHFSHFLSSLVLVHHFPLPVIPSSLKKKVVIADGQGCVKTKHNPLDFYQ